MTLSGPEEALAIQAATPPVSREAAQHVLDYLVWNKALLSENLANTAVLERYMTLVNDMKEGLHVVIQDPYQKATAMLFELVLSEEFNPWEIDLVRFTQLYMERLQAAGGVDFVVAGRLIYMAWNILVLQSREVLTQRTPTPNPDSDTAPDGAPMDDGFLSDVTTPEALDVTTSVLAGGTPPLEAMVRHSESRPVSLIELARAFHDAEEEARRSLEINEARERLRVAQRTIGEVLVHGEVPESDLAATWEVIARHPVGERFSLEEILKGVQSRERIVSLVLSALFLVREGVVILHQETIGSAPVLVERTSEARDKVRTLAMAPDLTASPVPVPALAAPSPLPAEN